MFLKMCSCIHGCMCDDEEEEDDENDDTVAVDNQRRGKEVSL